MDDCDREIIVHEDAVWLLTRVDGIFHAFEPPIHVNALWYVLGRCNRSCALRQLSEISPHSFPSRLEKPWLPLPADERESQSRNQSCGASNRITKSGRGDTSPRKGAVQLIYDEWMPFLQARNITFDDVDASLLTEFAALLQERGYGFWTALAVTLELFELWQCRVMCGDGQPAPGFDRFFAAMD